MLLLVMKTVLIAVLGFDQKLKEKCQQLCPRRAAIYWDEDPLMFPTLPFELLTGRAHQEWSPHVSGGKSGHGRGRNVRRSVSLYIIFNPPLAFIMMVMNESQFLALVGLAIA
jgi:hypothetical protein